MKTIDEFVFGGFFGFPVQITPRRAVYMQAPDFFEKFHGVVSEVAAAEQVPAMLLGAILYTEMSDYATHDRVLDDFEAGDSSYGGAQFRPRRELIANGIPAVQGKSVNEIRRMLEKPRSMAVITAQAMKQWNSNFRSQPGGYDAILAYQNASAQPERQKYLAGVLVSTKDSWGTTETERWRAGEQSWQSLKDGGSFQ